MEKKNAPKKIRVGNVSASIWTNDGEKDGRKYSFQTATFEIAYKDKKGEWQNGHNFALNDLLRLGVALDETIKSMLAVEKTED